MFLIETLYNLDRTIIHIEKNFFFSNYVILKKMSLMFYENVNKIFYFYTHMGILKYFDILSS
ncbi:hypothetical protein PFUGPA_04673 [Plasmodium falciparum Palo Alto/Uganda]|uniref:Uncharacterized protein n=2 Tax=Plasmodium falciparum TaxID=5833 RepID=W4IUM3_PLAFP|nr:hypothetical protein PFTANZ_01633 [Plasmodium falciparum Tanzania (2000708)]ETW53047.1 hypothetical protein PFUGPA_04673 [Plasmodium falciparum Palo Alto/Uganda]